MNIKRIKELQKLLEKNPLDPFLLYAMTLEFLGKNNEFCLASFRKLLTEFPDYLPTYYQAAQLFSDCGYVEEARVTYELGIEKTALSKNIKALEEIKNAFKNFEFEQDDQ
ncbi:tetratricopeptide repeat protein [Cyclobacteriaceae bacterium]|nr:tetratricopeptide repeat protein [bacterium]MDC1517441.1 tetratricopeptide repeat protein [Cyclobacteriaceae bacterium]